MSLVTLGELKTRSLLSIGYRKYVVRRFVNYCFPYNSRSDTSDEWVEKQTPTLTVGVVMEAVERRTFWNGYEYYVVQPALIKAFRERLGKMGVSEDDWPYIATPARAMDLVVQKAAATSKDALKDLDIRLLGQTVSRLVLERLSYVLGDIAHEFTRRITVREMLSLDPKKWVRAYAHREDSSNSSYFGGNISGSVCSMRDRLKGLGLSAEDGGILMSAHELRVCDICKKLSVSREFAERMILYWRSGWHEEVIGEDWAYDE